MADIIKDEVFGELDFQEEAWVGFVRRIGMTPGWVYSLQTECKVLGKYQE